MGKNAIKKFAVWARRELIERVSQKAMEYGIEKDNIVDAEADSINGKVLTDTQKNQRRALISQINAKGYEEVMEEVAYTWFNRLIALRFMEVNGYLPTRVRVFTNEENNFKPQIIDEAFHLDMDGLNMDKVYEFKNANQTEELYKYLLITQCNALNSILPGMFQHISDYTELLFPDNLLREGSVIEQMVSSIPEVDWQDAVQIIGWLYQYYNAEKKDEVFAALKKNVKITKENIPAATQLFTPDWIVRYMVENSLGRIFIERRKNEGVFADGREVEEMTWQEIEDKRISIEKYIADQMKWRYYLPEAEQSPAVRKQLDEIQNEYKKMNLSDIKVIDPCCGSGHILAYLFDVLMQIYESYGYTTREAVGSIVKNNLYGLDIDDRAAQLAYFAVMMKACKYDTRFLKRKDDNGYPDIPQPNVYAIQESNTINRNQLKYFGSVLSDLEKKQADIQIRSLLDTFQDAKEYGSILQADEYNWELLYRFVVSCDYSSQMEFETIGLEETKNKLFELVQIGATLAQKYDVVCTNPPYLGVSTAKERLNKYIKDNYYDAKEDLYLVFIEKCNELCKRNRFQAMITQHSWMFLSRSEKLRLKVQNNLIISMAHLGARAFEEIGGEVVQTTCFVLQKSKIESYVGRYKRLVDPTTQDGKEQLFLSRDFYDFKQDNCKKIPGNPVVYWISNNFISNFSEKAFNDIADSRVGLDTGNNDKFLRLWFEPDYQQIEFNATSAEQLHRIYWKKYVPHTKGGEYRKWYGNFEYVIAFDSLNYNLLMESGNHLPSRQFYFLEGMNWTRVSSKFAVRYTPAGMVFNSACPTVFVKKELEKYTLALLNTCVIKFYLDLLSPTINFQAGDVGKIPYLYRPDLLERVNELTEGTLEISKKDWDSFETSWDFTKHPLIRMKDRMKFTTTDGDIKAESYFLQGAYHAWENECEERFSTLKANEKELNRIFIDIYGLQDELTPQVEDKDVTVRKADLQRDIKSLISYAVGCMFGRYSLNVDGLVCAGGEWDASKYVTYPADKDNIIPICDDEYFDDDIVGRFVKFIEAVYGKDTLEENLKFIADTLGGKGQPREVIRNYFMNDFYADHCKTYQKRPIYWLFDSGKKNGFKALIYMHRYQPDTIARIRTDYVHEQQSRYRTAIADMENRIANAATGERVKLNKALTKLKDQDTELRSYEEKIHHLADQMISIDLDDGVKVNYAKFKDVLGKIK
ncbi:BREX-1 system adenine-specific DNA-methyltransferase PglX [Massiliimalia timonensis]|uniref:BREX-1 system adenine-specific DNA-methyltransferase PglX n=1 Tax=Massiliimalia timonensis TaxID=1987501 RepID=UPI00189CA150|nr:BREX-1 system adenine-specific DNA-methyltransferase PglX [Massiliimalia timonensis]